MLSYSISCPQSTLSLVPGAIRRRPDAPLFPVGTVLNECYRLRCVLGSGGMGHVYEAHDTALNRLVAIKVSRPDIAAETLVREARIMAAFRHPGLPTVHAMGKYKGVDYVVMERLVGRSLADYMDDGSRRFSEEETRDILLAVADSLEVLHQATLVHRDLKPSNIMLVPPDRIVLFDFGICDLERFATEENIVGTKYYIAPEVVTGAIKSGQVYLTDVYALGVIGFQMLTGRPPFPGESVTEVLTRLVCEETPSITEFRPDISPPMAGLIMDMLSKDPLGRPPVSLVKARLHVISAGDHAERPSEVSPGERPIRILVADDEPGIWDLMSYVLEDHGYEIVCVADGARALQELETRSFDIVITDKNMPHMSGLELLRTIKETSPTTDVILVTGYSSKAAEMIALNAGATCYLEKPFNIDELAMTVDRIAAKHRALRQRPDLRQ